MATSHESVSEQSRRRTTWLLLLVGLLIAILFLMVLCHSETETVQQEEPEDIQGLTVDLPVGGAETVKTELPTFETKGAQLIVTPDSLSLDNVVLGAQAEGVFVLRAEKGPVYLESKTLADETEGGFSLSGPCMERTNLNKDEECVLKVLWAPTVVQTIQNTLTIEWREDSKREYDNKRTQIQLKGSATDSKECVCCEIKALGEKKPRKVLTVNGEEIELNEDGTVKIADKIYKVGDELIIDPETKKIVAIIQPERIALGLNNEYLGRVTDRQVVVNKEGTVLGRLLGDGTLVDSDFNVLGAALPIVSVIDAQGNAIGKMKADDTGVRVVDAKDAEIGKLRVDGTVVDKAGVQIGTLRPWGLVLDLSGNYLGAILPSGVVVDSTMKTLGNVQPNGFVVSESGALIGGIVPQGMAVGTGCQAYGSINFKGEVKDIYGQIVGRVMLDGGIVDANFNEIGHVVNQGLVVDMKGKILGFVNSEGKAVDGKGKLMGCMTPNGTAMAKTKVLGGVMPKGYVTANACSVVGTVYPNGRVMSHEMKDMGVVRMDGYAINNSKKVIGMVVPHGTVMGESCHLVGVISATGHVMNEQKVSLGCINMDKQALDASGHEIGKITPVGPVIGTDGSVVGRVRYDGRIMDKKGELIDCVNPDGTSSVGVATASTAAARGNGNGGIPTGAVLDDKGNVKPYTVLADKVVDDKGETVGTIAPNGLVVNDKGEIKGFIPPDGVIFTAMGDILGSYNRLMGVTSDANGDELGYVMPDLTVLDLEKKKVLGALIPRDTVFVDFEGGELGHLTYEGQVQNEEGKVVGRVFADGSLYNANNVLIGGSVSSGTVLSSNGSQIGWADAKGNVLMKGTRVANLLPNGLAVTPDNRVLGRVWAPMGVMVSAQGVIGTVVSKSKGTDKTLYQGASYDKAGNYLGSVSPFGVLLGVDGRLGGIAAPITMVMDFNNNLIGWVDFKGQIINAENDVIGQLALNNVVVNAEGKTIGSLVQKGTVVDDTGAFIGRVGPDGKIYNGTGAVDLVLGRGAYTFNKDFSKGGRLLQDGIVLASNGKMLGWTTFDGHVRNSKHDVGFVSWDDRVRGEKGEIIASYIALGAPSVQEKEKMCGIVDENGGVVSASGNSVGSVLAPDYVIKDNEIVGRIRSRSLFVRELTNDTLLGTTDLSGLVYRTNTPRQTGSVMMNDFVADASKKIVGAVVPTGVGISNNLTELGTEDWMGTLWLGGKIIGASTGNGVVLENNTKITGGVFESEVIIDKNGLPIGRTGMLGAVIDTKGRKIASRMAFYSVLTPETIWVGGPIRTGTIVDDRARKVGVVAGDGSVVYDGVFKGHVLPDGSAAGGNDRAVYKPMPYMGHLAMQGLPMGYDGFVMGRTTIHGDIVDASEKIVYRSLDDGGILGVEAEKPLGRILPFVSAVSRRGAVLGSLNGDGKVVDTMGNEIGRVASNGAVKGKQELENLGALIPDTLIVNDCKVIGQVAYNGDVVDGKGNTIGRVQGDQWAEDPQGRRIGIAVKYGPVMSPDEPAVYLGRTMPDSTVVDTSGVIIGCVKNDGQAVKIERIEADGTVVLGDKPQVIGARVEQGPVINEQGEVIARVDSTGDVLSAETGDVMGYVKGDGTNSVYTFDHQLIGRAVSRSEELIFDEDGERVIATFDTEGIRRNPKGDIEFIVTKEKKILDQWRNEIGDLSDTGSLGQFDGYVYLYDMQNKPVARLNKCVLNKLPGNEKMGNVLANGEIRDDANELLLRTSMDNIVYNPDGTRFGRFGGVGLDLRRCGLSSTVGASGATRKISWGGKTYEIDPVTGMIIDPVTGQVVGSWDDVNKQPYIWDKPHAHEDIERPAPPLPKPMVIPEEVMKRYEGDLKKRRKKMKEKIGDMGNAILPKYNVEQMAQSGRSSDWSSVGVEKNNISTWPVDMSRVILADKAIPAVLQRSIDSRYADVPVTAIVERHIYGEAGRNILIPAGSRLIGQATSSTGVFGADQAAKIDITWTRLIRPDGAAFKFEAVSGDAQGRGGVAAYLDLQLLKKFGLPFISTIGEGLVLKLTELNEKSLVSGTTESAAGSSTTSETPGHQTRKMFIDNFKEMWGELMDMAGEIPNIVYVPAGTRLVAFSKEDLWLRSDEDPAEKPSNTDNPYKNGDTNVADNDSWTKKRSPEKTEEEDEEEESENTDTTSEGQENEPVYQGQTDPQSPINPSSNKPSDIETRIVTPVSRQKEKPAYF